MCLHERTDNLHGPPLSEPADLWRDVGDNLIGRFKDQLHDIAAQLSAALFADGTKIKTRYQGENRCAEFFTAIGQEIQVVARFVVLADREGRPNEMVVHTSLGREAQAFFAEGLALRPSFEELGECGA
jgi:hypothetical protein